VTLDEVMEAAVDFKYCGEVAADGALAGEEAAR
jgi:hypothetical protein